MKRKERFVFDKSSYLHSLIYSYGAVILVLFLIYFTTYFIMSNAVEREQAEKTVQLLENARDNVDNEMLMITQVTNLIAANNEMIGSFSREESLDFAYEDYIGMQYLKNVNITSGVVDEIYIYNKKRDKIISSSTTASALDFFDAKHNAGGYTFEEWKKFLGGSYAKTLTMLPKCGHNDENGVGGKYIAYVQSLPMNVSREKALTLVILINPSKLTERMGSVGLDEDGQFAVLNKEGEPLISVGKSIIPNKRLNVLTDGNITEKSGKYLVSTIRSDIISWKYIVIVPQTSYMNEVHTVKITAVICMILFICAGILLIYFFSRKNYRPLQSLLESLNIKNENIGDNEFGIILQNIENMQQEYGKMLHDSRTSKKQQKEKYIKSILEGSESARKLFDENVMRSYDFDADGYGYFVLLIKIENSSAFMEIMDMRLDMGQYALSNVISELFEMKKAKSYITPISGDTLGVIADFTEKTENAQDVVAGIIEHFTDFFRKNYGMELFIAVSREVEEVYELEDCYSEAVQAMKYRIVIGRGKTVFYGDIADKRIDYVYTAEQEREIAAGINGGDYERVEKVINTLFETNVYSRDYAAIAVQGFILELVRTLIKLVPSALVINAAEFEEKTAEEIKQKILEAVREGCSIQKNKGQSDIGNTVAEYVKNNYADPDLSVNTLGEKFGLSPSYLSKLFREQTGNGLLSYIHEVRTAHAEELLSKGMNIETVAEKVGYISGNSFARTYKKLRGITPGQYKRDKKTE